MKRLGWLIFEGGEVEDHLGRALYRVRKEAVLSNVEEISRSGAFDEICVLTSHTDLAEEARVMGAGAVLTATRGFSLGDWLARRCADLRLDAAVCSGGGSIPLLRAQHASLVAGVLRDNDSVVVLNNPQSPDLVGFSPTSALRSVGLPATDNELGECLRGRGLRREVLPQLTSLCLDIDTPVDAIILGMLPSTKERIRRRIAELGWSSERLRRAVSFLPRPMSEIGLIGRVGPGLVDFINSNFQVRLRVFSEERGMKALGRERRGQVVSVIGAFFDALGCRKALEAFQTACDAAFFDSRVLFAHWKQNVSQRDRFNSDLLLWEAIDNPAVREFTRSVVECRIPVVLGGHSLVSSGLRALAEALLGSDEFSQETAGIDRLMK